MLKQFFGKFIPKRSFRLLPKKTNESYSIEITIKDRLPSVFFMCQPKIERIHFETFDGFGTSGMGGYDIIEQKHLTIKSAQKMSDNFLKQEKVKKWCNSVQHDELIETFYLKPEKGKIVLTLGISYKVMKTLLEEKSVKDTMEIYFHRIVKIGERLVFDTFTGWVAIPAEKLREM